MLTSIPWWSFPIAVVRAITLFLNICCSSCYILIKSLTLFCTTLITALASLAECSTEEFMLITKFRFKVDNKVGM